MNHIPRIGTRRRAVYDALKNNGDRPMRRRELERVYMDVEPRAHSTLGVSQALKLYADRTRAGWYQAKDWVLGKEAAKIEIQQNFGVPVEQLAEVLRKGEPPVNAAPAATAMPKIAPPVQQEVKNEAHPPAPELKPRTEDLFMVGDIIRFEGGRGAGHPLTIPGHLYKVISFEKKRYGQVEDMVEAIDQETGDTVICFATRFKLEKPAVVEKPIEAPAKRRFYKGEKVAYVGGYNYFETRGYKVGDVFTVKFYGDAGGRENELGEFLFLEETPNTDGHEEKSFRPWPAKDDEIKCTCGAVSWGKAQGQNPWPHLVKEWRLGFRKGAPADQAGVHFLDKPCQLTNGLVAFRNNQIDELRRQLKNYKNTMDYFAQQVAEIKGGIELMLKDLDTGKNLPNPKR